MPAVHGDAQLESAAELHFGRVEAVQLAVYFAADVQSHAQILSSRPDGWSDSRIGWALINRQDYGWSPFGGDWSIDRLSGLRYSIEVHHD